MWIWIPVFNLLVWVLVYTEPWIRKGSHCSEFGSGSQGSEFRSGNGLIALDLVLGLKLCLSAKKC